MFDFFKRSILVHSPVDGDIVALDRVCDEVFSSKMAGDGVAVIPSSSIFCSPIDGKILRIFPTKHAFSIENRGVEILVHIGIDTVDLNGEGFLALRAVGDSVKVGDAIIEVDLDYLKSMGKDTITPIVVMEKSVRDMKFGLVERGDLIFKV